MNIPIIDENIAGRIFVTQYDFHKNRQVAANSWENCSSSGIVPFNGYKKILFYAYYYFLRDQPGLSLRKKIFRMKKP